MQTRDAKRRAAKGLWPREHGAYVQLLGPLLSALVLVPLSPHSWALALAACCVFLAHEPLLVLLGARGEHARRALHHGARRRLWLLSGTAALVVGYLAVRSAQLALSFVVPALLSAAAALLLLRGMERSLGAQLLSATTLASFCLPVLRAGQVPMRAALLFTAGWCAVHVSATLTARSYVYRKREGTGPLLGAAHGSLLLLVLCAGLAYAQLLPWSWSVALLPFALVALLLAHGVLYIKSPKSLGWLLTAANLGALLSFVLASSPR